MARKSRIDLLGIGDQVLLWSATMDVRTIARKIKETRGTTVNYSSVSRYISHRTAPATAIAQAKVEAVMEISKELLEGEWSKSLVEIRENYIRAKNEQDSRGMAEWMSRWQKHIEMILKLYRPPDTQITVDARQTTVERGSALKDWAKKVLSDG